MWIIVLATLLWLYAVALQKLIEIFLPLFGFVYDSFYISLLFSSVGIGLGLLFYAISLLKPSIKRYIKLGIFAGICFSLIGVYLVVGLSAFVDLLIFYIKVGFGLFLCAIPLIGTYGLFKKQRNTVLAAGAGILFFFFFARILLGDFVFSVTQIDSLLLFFILFICFLELGSTSVFFGSVIEKMTPHKEGNEYMLSRFVAVTNRYFAFIFIILLLCYGVTFVLFTYNDYIISSASGELIGIDLNSIYGIWLLVILIMLGSFMFWYLIPREKQQLSEE